MRSTDDLVGNGRAGRPPRVLVVTASVGAGHNSVARAITETLAPSGRVDVTVVDAMAMVPWWFRMMYADCFMLGMSRFPSLYALGYVLSDRPHTSGRGALERMCMAYERFATRRLQEYLRANRFDLIVHTHFLVPPVAAWMRRHGQLDTPQFVTVTDIETHRLWYCQDVDRWFLPSAYTAGIFRRWGVPEQRLTVSGIAVHSKWTAAVDRPRIYREWNLPADKAIVLLSGGTDYVCGPVVKIAHGICRACPQAYVVVLAGRNKGLLETLTHRPEPAGRVRAISFTDRGHELAEVCSLMITKPGGVTTAECLAKGTPMVLLNPVPGHEGGNAQYLACNEAAVISRGADEVIAMVARLLDHPPLLRQMADNARRLYRPGREIITEAVLQAVGRGA